MRILNSFGFFLFLVAVITLPTISARGFSSGGRARPSGGSSSFSKPAIGKPAYTAVGYPVNRPVRSSAYSTYPSTGYIRPYGAFFPGTVPLWLFGTGALYASGHNYALVDGNGAPAECDLPADSVDAYKVFNNFDAIVNGTITNSTSTLAVNGTIGTVVDNTGAAAPAFVLAPAPEASAPGVAAAPMAEGPGAAASVISDADRQAVLQAVDTGKLNLDSINPALVNQTYLLEQCSSAASKASMVVAAVISSIVVALILL